MNSEGRDYFFRFRDKRKEVILKNKYSLKKYFKNNSLMPLKPLSTEIFRWMM